MEKINELFEESIDTINGAFPSLYTKNDVIAVLNGLRYNIKLLPPATEPATISNMEFQEFSDSVSKRLGRSLNDGTIEPIDMGSAEFSLGYHNTIELEHINLDTDGITEELENILLDEFQNAFAKFLTKETE